MRGMIVGIDARIDLAGWLASGKPTGRGIIREGSHGFSHGLRNVHRLKLGNLLAWTYAESYVRIARGGQSPRGPGAAESDVTEVASNEVMVNYSIK